MPYFHLKQFGVLSWLLLGNGGLLFPLPPLVTGKVERLVDSLSSIVSSNKEREGKKKAPFGSLCKKYMKDLLRSAPQDWHDDYHVKHGENGKTRDVQRAIIAEVLHEKICRKGIRMLLNCRVSNSRFKEVKVAMKDHGGSYRIFRR